MSAYRGTWIAAAFALAGCSQVLKTVQPSALPGGAGSVTALGSGDDLVVPNLIGKSREEAFALVKAAGFAHDIESSRPVECENAQQIDGKINCQDPEAGKIVKKYTIVQINVYRTQRIDGAIVRAQLKALLGMAPEKAKTTLASYGHDGKVKVEPGSHFYDGCGENRVCGFNVAESGMGVHDDITLYVNPGLKISAPPE